MTDRELLDNEIVLTRDQVAKVLSIRPESVDHLHRVGALKGIKIGKMLRWRPDDLRRYVRDADAEAQ